MSDTVRWTGRAPTAPQQQAPSGDGTNLADILERVLDKGIVIAGDVQINLLDIELLTIKLRLVVASVDRAKEMGIDWWERDPTLSSGQRELEEENQRLRERIEALEGGAALKADRVGDGIGGDRLESPEGELDEDSNEDYGDDLDEPGDDRDPDEPGDDLDPDDLDPDDLDPDDLDPDEPDPDEPDPDEPDEPDGEPDAGGRDAESDEHDRDGADDEVVEADDVPQQSPARSRRRPAARARRSRS